MDEWRDIVDRLVGCFAAHERRLSILAQLDRAILERDRTISDIDAFALSCLCEQLPVVAAHLAVLEGRTLQSVVVHPAGRERQVFNAPENGPSGDPSRSSQEAQPSVGARSSFGSYHVVPLSLRFPNDAALVLVPANSEDLPAIASDDFPARLASQLEIAHRDRRGRHHRDLMDRFLSAFDSTNLDLSACLDFLRDEVRTRFRVAPIPPRGLVQILTVENVYLYVRSTTSDEPVNTRVSLSQSAAGFCIAQRLHQRVSDPTTDPNYKAIGANPGVMRSELVVPLWSADHIYGAINVEFDAPEAFSTEEVEHVLDLSEAVGPILRPLVARRNIAIRDRQIMFYAVKTMCERLVVLYNHQLTSPIHNARRVLELLATEHARIPEDKRVQLLANIGSALSRLETAKDDLFKNFNELVVSQAYDLHEIVVASLNAVGRVAGVRFEYVEDVGRSRPLIYCSRLLREHIINVLQNAVDSVTLRLSERSSPEGLIRLWMERREAKDAKELNHYLVLKIRDNGIGIPAEELHRVFVPNYSTKGTMGIALSAVRSYMHTIGGTIDFDSSNTPGSAYCEMRLAFQVYVKEVHEQGYEVRDPFRQEAGA